MFTAMLRAQWKWSRYMILISLFAAFALPMLSARDASGMNDFDIAVMLDSMSRWGYAYPILAAGIGLLLALSAWSADHRGKHVYALSLPLPRWTFVLFRFAAGALLLTLPVVALWAGALVATIATTLPASVHAYPTVLAMRFGLAALVSYSVFFAVSAGTNRTAGYLLVVIAIIVGVQILLNTIESGVDILDPITTTIFMWPGPLVVFTGRWMLFDV